MVRMREEKYRIQLRNVDDDDAHHTNTPTHCSHAIQKVYNYDGNDKTTSVFLVSLQFYFYLRLYFNAHHLDSVQLELCMHIELEFGVRLVRHL